MSVARAPSAFPIVGARNEPRPDYDRLLERMVAGSISLESARDRSRSTMLDNLNRRLNEHLQEFGGLAIILYLDEGAGLQFRIDRDRWRADCSR